MGRQEADAPKFAVESKPVSRLIRTAPVVSVRAHSQLATPPCPEHVPRRLWE